MKFLSENEINTSAGQYSREDGPVAVNDALRRMRGTFQ
jgi:hypothetical protein